MQKLIKDIGLPRRLGEVGISEKDIPFLVKEASESAFLKFNPRSATEEDLTYILKGAL